jgi:hypothetical protein
MSKLGLLRITRRVGVVMLATSLALLATGSAASADVVIIGHTISTGVVTNPCDTADGPITVTTDTRWETRLQPDGTLITHFVNHSSGISASGTEYIANRQATNVTPAGSTSVEFNVEIRRISEGPGQNALITISGILGGPTTTTVSCVG